MGLEEAAVGAAKKVTEGVVKAVTDTIQKAWSIMDAASEKPSPREYLSDRAIAAIQGVGDKLPKGSMGGS